MPQKFTAPQGSELIDTIFVNARIIDPETGFDKLGYLVVKDGKIADFGAGDIHTDIEKIDCGGNVLCPGLLDIQVHFRTPGQEHKEDIITGTKSAAAGGVTTAVCMANTSPTIDNEIVVRDLYDVVEKNAYVNVFTYAAITKGLQGKELTDMAALKKAGVVGFSDDGLPVMNSLTMRRAMENARDLDILISQHAEDSNLSDGGCINEGQISKKLGLKGVPNASEAIIVERDILLSELVDGVRYHVLHISTHQAIEAVRRAKSKGYSITCEAAPHHFILTDEAVLHSDTLAKMNPPLRANKDKLAIIEGLRDGTIDVIATDHAPHDVALKSVHISKAAFGIVGLETMLPLSLVLYHTKQMSLLDILAKMTYKAADVIKKPLGRIKKDAVADLVLIDLDVEWEIQSSEFSSKSKNSPFDGYKVKGRAIRTVVAGKTVFELSNYK
jgi:dihydroorotase